LLLAAACLRRLQTGPRCFRGETHEVPREFIRYRREAREVRRGKRSTVPRGETHEVPRFVALRDRRETLEVRRVVY